MDGVVDGWCCGWSERDCAGGLWYKYEEKSNGGVVIGIVARRKENGHCRLTVNEAAMSAVTAGKAGHCDSKELLSRVREVKEHFWEH